MQRIPGATKTAVILLDSQIKKLDEVASRFKISRSEALRLIVDSGLDSYAIYEGLGVVKLAEIMKRIRKAIERDVQPSIFEPVAFE